MRRDARRGPVGRERGRWRIGFEANYYATVGQIDRARAGRFPRRWLQKNRGRSPIGAGGGSKTVMVKIRMVKDDHEIDLVRQIGRPWREEAFDAIRGGRDQGRPPGKAYLAGLMVFEVAEEPGGRATVGFPGDRGDGGRTELRSPHYRPGRSAWCSADQPCLIDWGAVFKGVLLGPATRTMICGPGEPAGNKQIL